MGWQAFSIKQNPTLGVGASASIDDSVFPFGAGSLYRSVSVWVTTAGSANYSVTCYINDVAQDSISLGSSKSVANYTLDQILIKDPSLKFKATITNTSPSSITFTIVICGEYFV